MEIRDFIERLRADRRFEECAFALMVESNSGSSGFAEKYHAVAHSYCAEQSKRGMAHTAMWGVQQKRKNKKPDQEPYMAGFENDNNLKDLSVNVLGAAMEEGTLHIAPDLFGSNADEALKLMESELIAQRIEITKTGKRNISGKSKGPDDIGTCLMIGIAARMTFVTYAEYFSLLEAAYSDDWPVELS